MDFDAQAPQFDARAGLGADVARSIAAALLSIADLKTTDSLLEIGAGTGEIVMHLVARCHYVGLDRSPEMLRAFRARTSQAQLFVADASRGFPVRAASVRAVFLSRVAHLLDGHTLLSELARVAHPQGCFVLFGRRGREQESPQRILQRELHARLRAHGLEPRQGERATRALRDALLAEGAQPVADQVAAQWTVAQSPADSLSGWQSKSGLSGLELPDAEKRALLADLTVWAAARWPDLEAKVSTREHYLLSGTKLCG